MRAAREQLEMSGHARDDSLPGVVVPTCNFSTLEVEARVWSVRPAWATGQDSQKQTNS
jgi:hypothetical protein